MKHDFLSQTPFACKLDWGIPGTERAALRGDIIVLVDILSFSTTTVYAVSKGTRIYPCADSEDPQHLAQAIGGEFAVERKEVPQRGRYSLSPCTYDDIQSGKNIVLPSLNGAACARYSLKAPYIFVGALLNAFAVAREVSYFINGGGIEVTVIACGEKEKEPDPGGDLRVAIEDYLGAGAIIAAIEAEKSPEAIVCEAAYIASAENLSDLIWESISGRELRKDGFEEDVLRACRKDSIQMLPILKEGAFGPYKRVPD